MRTFYFDMRDGVPVRDRIGLQLPGTAEAVEHSKMLARRFSRQHPVRDPDLFISVVDESGTEVHREQVYAGTVELKVSSPPGLKTQRG